MTLLERVEIHPVRHCTLACDACQHGSAHHPKVVHQADDYLPHLQRLATFANWQVLMIGGGEPFLHPDLAGFIGTCKLGRPVHIVSNGFWLLRGDWYEFARPVFLTAQYIVVSRYPPYVDRLGVTEWDRRLARLSQETGCPISSFHPSDPVELTFDHHEHHDSPLPIVRACTMRRCVQLLHEGRLARCPLGRWLDRIPGRTAAFVAAYDRSGYYDLNRGGEGFAEWAEPEAFEACSYCGLATGHLTIETWRQEGESKRAIYQSV